MKRLVETCFILDTKMIKRDLLKVRKQIPGISGFFNISNGANKAVADWYIEYGTEYDYLVLQYGEKDQMIKLAESELHFGPRSWFICDCGARVSKLYLPPQTTQFKCRHCHKLVYEITTCNRRTKQGELKYRFNRMIRLMNTRENIRSMFYNGQYTERYNRYLKFAEVLGLDDIVRDAKRLLEDINGEQQSI